MPSSPSDPASVSKDTVEQSLKLLRELARTKDVPQKGVTVTDAPSTLLADVPSTPTTDAPSAPATEAASALATDIPSAPAADVPSNDQETAHSDVSSTQPPSHRLAGGRLLWLVALGFSFVVAGLITTFLYRAPKSGGPVASSPLPASPAPVEKPAEQASTQGLSDLQSVQKAMAECDNEAAQNPAKLYLLIIPVAPVTALAQATRPEGETYQTFSLMTSKATLSGLENASYAIDPRPFLFSIDDPASGERRTWNLVSGLRKIVHNGPEQFLNFRVGFDPTGRGFGLVWSSSYARQPGTCYWINTRFRAVPYEGRF